MVLQFGRLNYQILARYRDSFNMSIRDQAVRLCCIDKSTLMVPRDQSYFTCLYAPFITRLNASTWSKINSGLIKKYNKVYPFTHDIPLRPSGSCWTVSVVLDSDSINSEPVWWVMCDRERVGGFTGGHRRCWVGGVDIQTVNSLPTVMRTYIRWISPSPIVKSTRNPFRSRLVLPSIQSNGDGWLVAAGCIYYNRQLLRVFRSGRTHFNINLFPTRSGCRFWVYPDKTSE